MVLCSVNRLLLAAAALIVVGAACGHGVGGGSTSSGSPSTSNGQATPTVSLTVPNDPSAHVTDVRAYGLTRQQAAALAAACSQAAGVPDTNEDCKSILAEIASAARSGRFPPCGPLRPRCFVVGAIANQNRAVFKLTDSQGGHSNCTGNEVTICHATTVPRSTVQKVFGPVPTAIASSGASPSPTSAGSLEPSSSNPAPPPSSGGPAAHPAPSGAGLSP